MFEGALSSIGQLSPEKVQMKKEEAAALAKNEEEKRQQAELLATFPEIDGSSTS